MNVEWSPSALMDLIAHCKESNEHGDEVCGLLVGKKSERRNLSEAIDFHLVVTDILRLKTANASGAHVIATADAWAEAEREMEQFLPLGKERLGWYHTHPTQGIFFSGQDRDFHSVFTKEYQFALVVDPREMKGGIFFWQNRLAGTLSDPLLCELNSVDERSRPNTKAFFRELIRTCLTLMTVLVQIIWIYWQSRKESTPAVWAIYAVALAVVLLRLWNFKHWGQLLAVEGGQPETMFQAIRYFALLGALLLVGVCACYGVYAKSWKGKVVEASGNSAQALGTGSQMSGGVSEDLTIEVRVHGKFIFFFWSGSKVAAFQEQDKSFTPLWGERELFGKILGKPIDLEGYRQIQRAIGVEDDGYWIEESRRVFVEKAKKGKTLPITAGREIIMKLRED